METPFSPPPPLAMPSLTSTGSVTSHMEDQIVVSVGPYMFHREPHRLKRLTAKSALRASPPQSILSLARPCHPALNRRRQVAGVACMNVMLFAVNFLARSSPSAA